MLTTLKHANVVKKITARTLNASDTRRRPAVRLCGRVVVHQASINVTEILGLVIIRAATSE